MPWLVNDLMVRDRDGFLLLTALKHLLVGLLFLVIGIFMTTSNNRFIAASEPAELPVYKVESRKDSDGTIMFRPMFALVTDKRPQPTYTGGLAASFMIHRAGDVVSGRYDAATGMIQSDRLTEIILWLARLMQVFGVIAVVQSVTIRLGMPEFMLPLPVRVR